MSTTTPLLEEPRVISYKNSIVESLRTGLPFGISTAAAGNTFLTSMLFADIGTDAVAIGPFATALQNFAIGICRASLLSISLAIGPINGKARSLEDAGRHEEAKVEYEKIGEIVRQGWVMAAVLGVGASAFLGLSGPLLDAIGIQSEIADQTQEYFKYYLMGNLPLLHSFADQQIAVGTKNAWLPSIRGPLYGAMVYGFGYLLSNEIIKPFGHSFKGVPGVGMGSAAAAWTIFALTKLAHLLPSAQKYQLYKRDFEGKAKALKKLSSLALKLGFQVATEWANLLGLSLIVGHMGKESDVAMQPSIQLLTLSGLFSLGFSAGVGANCANAMGQLKHTEKDSDARAVADKSLVRRGNVGAVSGVIVPALLTSMMLIQPEIFTRRLLSAEATEGEVEFANTVMRINALGLIVDSMRINGAGPLRAFRDINFVTWVSVGIMSVIGLAAEAGACVGSGAGLEAFSWIRDLSIMIPMMLVIGRWLSYAMSSPDEKIGLEALHTESGGNCHVMFQPKSALSNRVEVIKDDPMAYSAV